MEDITELLRITKQGNMMNTLERFRIDNITRLDIKSVINVP